MIDGLILNFTVLSVVGVLQYSLLPPALCNLLWDRLQQRKPAEAGELVIR